MKVSTISLLWLVVLIALFSTACNRTEKASPNSSTKHYQLKGKVVSIDRQGKMVNIDNDPIPGFMESMTMPYQVKPEDELQKLHSGDTITADLVVQDANAWLENISVTAHAAMPEAKK